MTSRLHLLARLTRADTPNLSPADDANTIERVSEVQGASNSAPRLVVVDFSFFITSGLRLRATGHGIYFNPPDVKLTSVNPRFNPSLEEAASKKSQDKVTYRPQCNRRPKSTPAYESRSRQLKINMTDKSDNDLLQLPKLITNNEDASWVGFPLLRYICVARLLQMSSQLRQSDNTGCLRLLMRAYQEEEASGTGVEGKPRALELTRFAKILQDPLIEENQRIQNGVTSSVNGEVNPNGKSDEVEVVQFQEGSLGIILTAAGAPFEDRLAVKSFTKDPTRSDGVGQAEASGKVHLGDLLQSINGVPIVGVTTEEVKRRLQLIDRPIYMGFCHCSDAYGDVDAATSDVSEAFDASNSANSSLTSDAALAELHAAARALARWIMPVSLY
ncbi:hypothetical protein ON010_g16175 [Phytophthora cinnamomi]|nr:hypothetical protein ON010_g16175 [Phytophthora cinnamomi]